MAVPRDTPWGSGIRWLEVLPTYLGMCILVIGCCSMPTVAVHGQELYVYTCRHLVMECSRSIRPSEGVVELREQRGYSTRDTTNFIVPPIAWWHEECVVGCMPS